EIYALHCAPLPVGTLAVLPGSGLPGLDVGRIDLPGPDAAAHGERLVAALDGLSTVSYPQTAERVAQFLDDMRKPGGPLARFVYAESGVTSHDDGACIRV